MNRSTTPYPEQTTRSSSFRRAISTLNLGLVLQFVGLAIFFTIGLGIIQFSTPALVGTDGYYHLKMGWLIRQFGFKPEFIWLPQTILNADAYYNHHFLYHVYLSMFAWGNPAVDQGAALILGGKLAAIAMPAAAFLMIWWMLTKRQVPYAWAWAAALLLISDGFLYRMHMVRAQSASLLILAITLHLLFEKRYRGLVIVGFFYVWFYNAFPLLIAVVGAYSAAILLLERRLEWQPLAWATGGIVLGLLVNPYFPENLTFIYNHLLPKLGDSAVKVGNEWKPYRTWTLVENSGPALVLTLSGLLALGWQEKRIDRFALTGFFLMAGFGLMLFQSRRFIEYFPPFALIFAALAIAPLLTEWKSQIRRAWIIPAGLVLLMLYPLNYTITRSQEQVADSQSVEKYAAASRWLDENTEGTPAVFQTDWDDFTRLFFHNTNATYTLGLDPTYMQLYDEPLYETWVDITRGRVDEPSKVISEQFGGEYVFTDHKHGNFLDNAAEDPYLVEIYRDEYAVIFEVTR